MIARSKAEKHLHDAGTPAAPERYGHDGHTLAPSAAHLEALGWAFTHPPTQEAYRRSTGEDLAPALRRYQEWVEENVTGPSPTPPSIQLTKS